MKSVFNPKCTRCGKEMVGAPGFEPGAFGSQSRRATRLRYAPFGLRKVGETDEPRSYHAVRGCAMYFVIRRHNSVLLWQVAFQRFEKHLYQRPRQRRPPTAQADRDAQPRVGKAYQLLHGHPERPRHPQRHKTVAESDPRHLGHRLEGLHGVFDVNVYAPLPLAVLNLALDEAPGLRLRRRCQHPQFARNGKFEAAQVTRHDDDGFVDDIAGFQVRGVSLRPKQMPTMYSPERTLSMASGPR